MHTSCRKAMQFIIFVEMQYIVFVNRDGTLPWRLKSELSNFSKLTKAVSSEGR